MSSFELILIAVGVSMDAFAVSVCKGLQTKKVLFRQMLLAGLWFGGFQGLMPFIGYHLGRYFQKYIAAFDHWVAFGLLFFIGVSMIKEAFDDDDENVSNSFAIKTMFVMAVATSIDALAVGVTFGLVPGVNIYFAVATIGATTMLFSMIGVRLGCVLGHQLKTGSEIIGGLILISLGIRILLTHMM